jgi:excisionase family DNA binding protein
MKRRFTEMNPSRPGNDTFPSHSFDLLDEAAIRQRTDRVGKQVGEAVSSLLAEVILSIVMSRSQMVVPPSSNAHSQASPIPPSRPDSILTAGEVAQILRLSKAKAYRLMQTGEIRSIQFDRTTRVRRQDLDEFIKTHTR